MREFDKNPNSLLNNISLNSQHSLECAVSDHNTCFGHGTNGGKVEKKIVQEKIYAMIWMECQNRINYASK